MAITAIKSIRLFCLECTSEDRNWIKDCPSKKCPLWPFRMGTNPNVSEATRAKRRAQAEQQNLGQKTGTAPLSQA